jgi:hypothetical protein
MPRSALPLAAACFVANGIRETLSSVLETPVDVRLFPASLPERDGWAAVLRTATCYRLRGPAAEAVLILRHADGCALAMAGFGEPEASSSMTLSPMERTVCDRIITALAGALSAICGATVQPERIADPGSLATYFELQIERPVFARLGVGLRRDPVAVAVPALELADLADILIKVRVRFVLSRIPAAHVATLEPGDVIRAEPAVAVALTPDGSVLAVGEGGVSGGRYAFSVRHVPGSRGSNFA